jgi:hypothetical protein
MFMTLIFPLDQSTAGTAETVYAMMPVGAFAKYAVVGATFVPDTNRTASDTDYATCAVRVGSQSLGSFTTQTTGSGGTGNLTAGTGLAFTLANEEAYPHSAGASHINVAVTKSGSGVALTGTVTVLIEAVRA